MLLVLPFAQADAHVLVCLAAVFDGVDDQLVEHQGHGNGLLVG